MTTSTTDVTRHVAFTHGEAMDLQQAELAVTLELLHGLDAAQWATNVPDCPEWDVRAMYLHVLGAFEGAAFGEMAHQMRAARRLQRTRGGALEASLSAVQVADRAALTPEELVARLGDAGQRGVERRRRLPGVMRSGVRMKVDGPVVERWALGYLIDTIYLRDLWLHRIDACRALGLEPRLSADHDARIVADVVGEWAGRHGQPFHLQLDGAAGGSFSSGDGGASFRFDAIEFCRVLSGRSPAPQDLPSPVVPF